MKYVIGIEMTLLTRQARMGLSISSLHPRMVVTSRQEIARNTTGSTPTPNGTSTSPSMIPFQALLRDKVCRLAVVSSFGQSTRVSAMPLQAT